MNETHRTHGPGTQVAVGAAVLSFGLVLLAQQSDLLPGWSFGGLWPIILVVAGLVRLVSRRGRDGAGVVMTTLGVVLLLHTQAVVPLGDGWPLLIVGQGLAMLVRSGRGCGARREPDHGR